jgi:hypothetical protein
MPILTYDDLEDYLSRQRLHRFLTACSGDKVKALQLYKVNMKISQAFHPLLSLFEVILRNQINSRLSRHFGDNDWILNQRTGFMSDGTLRKGGFFLKKQVNLTESRLIKDGGAVNSEKVIAALNFGFWTALFDTQHYKLLKGKPIRIFTELPPNKHRKDIFVSLTTIREFRNRINHNEPICFKNKTIDFTNTVHAYKALRKTLKWINPNLLSLIKEFDSVLEEIKKAKVI